MKRKCNIEWQVLHDTENMKNHRIEYKTENTENRRKHRFIDSKQNSIQEKHWFFLEYFDVINNLGLVKLLLKFHKNLSLSVNVIYVGLPYKLLLISTFSDIAFIRQERCVKSQKKVKITIVENCRILLFRKRKTCHSHIKLSIKASSCHRRIKDTAPNDIIYFLKKTYYT